MRNPCQEIQLGVNFDVRHRAAKALGWSIKDTRGLSLASLRELIRDKDPELAEEMSCIIRNGTHISY